MKKKLESCKLKVWYIDTAELSEILQEVIYYLEPNTRYLYHKITKETGIGIASDNVSGNDIVVSFNSRYLSLKEELSAGDWYKKQAKASYIISNKWNIMIDLFISELKNANSNTTKRG